jgi:hypothetical protein
VFCGDCRNGQVARKKVAQDEIAPVAKPQSGVAHDVQRISMATLERDSIAVQAAVNPDFLGIERL